MVSDSKSILFASRRHKKNIILEIKQDLDLRIWRLQLMMVNVGRNWTVITIKLPEIALVLLCCLCLFEQANDLGELDSFAGHDDVITIP